LATESRVGFGHAAFIDYRVSYSYYFTFHRYYFTIIGYVVFYKQYENVFDPEAERLCTEFWKCYVTTFDWTFKFTGSIGARLQDPDTIQLEGLESDEDYDYVSDKLPVNFYSRFTFDNLFNIILVMILLNMIQGIIIDTFGSLREELQAKIDD
jgi:inositol 1,4,5-triphosphate receptor type 3